MKKKLWDKPYGDIWEPHPEFWMYEVRYGNPMPVGIGKGYRLIGHL